MMDKCQYCGCDDWGHGQLAAANERAKSAEETSAMLRAANHHQQDKRIEADHALADRDTAFERASVAWRAFREYPQAGTMAELDLDAYFNPAKEG